jgi:UDP-N-acetylglucosamine 2-epimerase (non-hydrolysing)/GDP/UDP-N,N'-diacetylbacillosamine 2-epimerase (hydrolysing)
MRRVCAVTSSRADYGVLYWVLRGLRDARDVELFLVATGMHLAPEHGLTWRQIEADGFTIAEKIPCLLADDTPAGIAKSVGLAVTGFAEFFARRRPDVVLLLGDRFEIFGAAQAAYLASIPIAHVAGGDVTEGSLDDGMRHAITKFATLHFVTNAEAQRRVRQLGEDPARIFLTGSPGIDYIRKAKLLSRQELERELGAKLLAKNLVVTFHPPTAEPGGAARQFAEICAALGELDAEKVGIFLTHANADAGGTAVNAMIDEFVAQRRNAHAYKALGPQLYLSLVAVSDGVIGNSSSGLYEAPSFAKPTVNVGDRQKGRLRAASVIDCVPERQAIARALRRALDGDWKAGPNPYGDGESAPRIVRVLGEFPLGAGAARKQFHDLAEVGP